MNLLQNIFLCILMYVFSFNAQSCRTQDKFPDSYKSATIIVLDNITDFFSLLIEHNNEKAYQQILAKSPLLNDKQNFDKLIKDTSKIEEFYGKLTQYECIKTEFVTKSYKKTSCLGFCAMHPIHRIFTYYNSPESGRFVTNINFNDLTENYFTEEK